MNLSVSKKRLNFGGDYNPEQWPAEIVDRDISLMKASEVNTVTINVFSWASLQPDEENYDFSRLDAVFDKLEGSGIDVILATPTAAPPAWMFQQDPTLLKVNENGQRAVHWSRQAYCPNHPLYDKESRKMARALAQRYGKRSNLILWHINNEYIVHCYCDYCAASFRKWLMTKYGTLERLNEAWQLSQWSLLRTDWEQITPPLGGMSHTSHSLDYQRFLSDSNLNNYLAEKEEILRITPELPVTTNFYSLDFRGQIHHQWASHLDVIAWDSYPPHQDHAVWAAFQHDYFRSMKQQPFLLMEQATSSVNWKTYNPAKRPGMTRLQSYQALARGADAIMYFQFRQSRGGVEKFHSALVSHGTETDNRIFREVGQLGQELAGLSCIGSSRIKARVAILFDMTLTWLVDWNKASQDIVYRDTVTSFYRPFYEANIPVDVVHPLVDLSRYDVVVAPMLYMFEEGVPEQLREFVRRGGKLVMSYLSGMVNGCDVVEHGGFLRPIDDVFGITVEEWDAFEPGMSGGIAWSPELPDNDVEDSASSYAAEKWAEVIRLQGAEALAVFTQDYHAGQPAVTRSRYGLGEAYYVATQPEPAFLSKLLLDICRSSGVKSLCAQAPQGIEVSLREDGDRRFLFVLNHNSAPAAVDLAEAYDGLDLIEGGQLANGRLELSAYSVTVLELKQAQSSGESGVV